MSTNHLDKYATKLILGIILVTAGVFQAMYIAVNSLMQNEWYIWAFLVAVLMNTGLIFLCKAFVHKMKADLIRKQKHHDQHKNFIADKNE